MASSLEYYDGTTSSWLQLLTGLTLTGAVTGTSSGSTITTTLAANQTVTNLTVTNTLTTNNVTPYSGSTVSFGTNNVTTSGTVSGGSFSGAGITSTTNVYTNTINQYSGTSISFGANLNLGSYTLTGSGTITGGTGNFTTLNSSAGLNVNTISPYSGAAVYLATVNITSSLSVNNIGGFSVTTVTCGSNLVLSGTYSLTAPGTVTTNNVTAYSGGNININSALTCGSNNITTSGVISAQGGGVICNNWGAYTAGASMLFISPLSMGANNITTTGTVTTGTLTASTINCSSQLLATGTTFNSSINYGYLLSSGAVGNITAGATYSIKATYGVMASQYYAISSIKKKRILARGLSVENEVVNILKNTEFFKYEFKDSLTEPGVRYGIIAEELAKTLPFYVDATNAEHVANIYQMADVSTDNDIEFVLDFENTIEEELEGTNLRLINVKNEDIFVEIIDKIGYNKLIVKSETKLDDKMFAYGTYEKCPSVSSKVNELTLIATKNLIKRVEKLENVKSKRK